MENPLISVIVPIYKVEKYLDKCIDSIVSQTHKELEIILVDDGSPDSCPEICDKWAKKDSRIIVIHKENGGVSSARNAGLDIAKGEYIAFVDADDYLDLDMYEIMLYELIKYNADAARCAIVRESESGKKENWGDDNAQAVVVEQKQLLADIGEAVGILPVSPDNKLFKRSVIGDIRFDTRFKYAEDTLFNFMVARNISSIVYHDLPRYHYANNPDSAAHKEFDENRFAEHMVMDIIFSLADEETLPHCIKGDVLKSLKTIKDMCTSGNHTDRFQEIRKRVVSHKSEILFSDNYSRATKLKTILLFVLNNLYKVLIKAVSK